MFRTTALSLLLGSLTALAQVHGDVVVVTDTQGTSFNGGAFAQYDLSVCAFGARGLFQLKPDQYDAVVVFTTHPMTGSGFGFSGTTPAGNLVRQDDKGVTYGNFLIRQPPSAYGSNAGGKLSHCIWMGPTRQWPTAPDAPFLVPAGPFGGTQPSGLTGIEVLGHEMGHHWLVNATFDRGTGKGTEVFWRGDTRTDMDANPISSSVPHWSFLSDARSVMWGNFVTDLGAGVFKLEGGVRGYGPMDQYFMGLRGANETPPMLVINDGTNRGLADNPLAPGQSKTVTGTKVMVGVPDVVRSIGPRVPAYPNAQRCFRTAFVIVAPQGTVPSAGEIAMVDNYRKRWESWFSTATEQRGVMGTRLDVAPTCPPPGVPVTPDAGTATPDAGNGSANDAGTTMEVDAGTSVQPMPMPMPQPMGGEVVDEMEPDETPETLKLKRGCGCSTGAAPGTLVLGLLLALRLSRNVRRERRND